MNDDTAASEFDTDETTKVDDARAPRARFTIKDVAASIRARLSSQSEAYAPLSNSVDDDESNG